MKKLLVTIIILTLTVLPLAAIELPKAQTWTTITSLPYVINTPGHYQLYSDETATTLKGIHVNCSGVVINGNGYTVTAGASTEYLVGLGSLNNNVTNIEIYNLKLNGLSTCIRGIDVYERVDNMIIKNCYFYNLEEDGVTLGYGSNITITKSTFINCQYSSIYFTHSISNTTIYNNYFDSAEGIVALSYNIDTYDVNLYVTPTWEPRPPLAGRGPAGGNYYGLSNGTGWSQIMSDLDQDGFIDQSFLWRDYNGDRNLTDLYPLSTDYYTEQEKLYNSLTWFTIHIALTLGAGFLLYTLTKSKWGFFMGIFAGMILIYVMIPGMSANLWAFILIGVSLIIAVFAGEHVRGIET